MNVLERLADPARKLGDRLAGRYLVEDPDPERGFHDESGATLDIVPMLGGRFVRLDYARACKGSPQEGSLLLGWERKAGKATIQWIDGWHNGDKVMARVGSLDEDGTMRVAGSYAAAPGPD